MKSSHVERRRRMSWSPLSRSCLYCGLEFSEATEFCPTCGRPTERGFCIRPMPRSISDHRQSLKDKEETRRRLEPCPQSNGPHAYRECPYCRLWFSETT